MDEKEWLKQVAEGLDEFLATHGYVSRSGRSMFCTQHGITPRQLRALRNGEYFVPTPVYAILNWICGIEAANPTEVPPFVKHLPTGGVTHIKRAWNSQEYLVWIGQQNDSDLITGMAREMEFGDHAGLVAEIEPALYQLERLLWKVINTGDETLWDKLAEQFGPVIPNLYALLSALTLDGGNRTTAIAMLLEGGKNE